MKKRDIVKDAQGNHFVFLGMWDGMARCQSVATKELFNIPVDELSLTDRVER